MSYGTDSSDHGCRVADMVVQDTQRGQTGRYSHLPADEVRVEHQSEDRKDTWDRAPAIASGPNLTFRFAEGFRVGLGCASLRDARANEYPIERRRPLRA